MNARFVARVSGRPKPVGRSAWRSRLLASGIASSLLYLAMNVYVALQWPSYSSVSQTVSELSAVGAPTRDLWVPLGHLYTFLVTAFGLGVWLSADDGPKLRTVGVLVATYGFTGVLWPLVPMHERHVLAAGGGTWTDTMHLVLGAVTVFIMACAIAVGAAALDKWFKLYSIATLIVLVVFGALTGLDGPRVAANVATPWVGVWERINIGAFLLWVVVLASVLLHRTRQGVEGRHAVDPARTAPTRPGLPV